jgi:cadmium resistance protein CadD (predicted permease)
MLGFARLFALIVAIFLFSKIKRRMVKVIFIGSFLCYFSFIAVSGPARVGVNIDRTDQNEKISRSVVK